MRVVVPYTDLHPSCRASLDRYCPGAELYDVSGDPTDYWRVLRDVWADGETFLLVEHDVSFDQTAIEILETCPRPHCTVAGFFRLTRFRAEMMRAIPDVFETLPTAERHWIPLEWQSRTAMERAGFAQHHHTHEAPYHNATRGLNGHTRAGLYTSADRWPVWRDWCLASVAPDEWPESVERYVIAQRGPCSLFACKRRFHSSYSPAAFPQTCWRCRDEPWNTPRLDQWGGCLA